MKQKVTMYVKEIVYHKVVFESDVRDVNSLIEDLESINVDKVVGDMCTPYSEEDREYDLESYDVEEV